MDKYIVVFGGSSLDCVFKETKQGYSNEPTEITFGGKGANQAIAAKRSGYNVKIITCVANDKYGEKMLENLSNNGVDISCCEKLDGIQNDMSRVNVSLNGENEILRQTGAINHFSTNLVDKYADIIKNAEMVVAQYKIPKEVSEYLIDFCYKNNVKIVVTPCRPDRLSVKEEKNQEIIDKITYITCNEKEAKIVFDNDNIEDIVAKYPNKLIVTLGENGAIFNNGKKNIKIPAFIIKNVVDTTGAGDTLNGNFVVSMLKGFSLEESIKFGMASSSLKIQTQSAQKGMPKRVETEKFLKEYLNDNARSFN